MSQPASDATVAAATAGTSPLSVRTVTRLEDLAALAPIWDELLAASETSTPFLTLEWLTTWWESFGAGQELLVLVVEDETGIAAVAPFARARRQVGPLGYRAIELVGTGPLRFLGMGLADRADLLLARRREECARAVLHHLATLAASFEVVDLRFVPSTSTTVRVFRDEAQAAGLRFSSEPCAESPFLPLSGSFEDYVAGRGKNFRKGLKRKRDKLDTLGEVTIDLDAVARDPEGALAAAVEVSLTSWKEREGTALLLHENVRRFFAALVPRMVARDRLYLSLLRVGGDPVAHELGYLLDGKAWSYDSAYKLAFAPGSPGVLLTAQVLEQAHRTGLIEYDFMRGNEGYKQQWETASRHELQCLLDTGTGRARAAREFGYRAKWRLKRSPRLVTLQRRLGGVAARWLGRRRGKPDA